MTFKHRNTLHQKTANDDWKLVDCGIIFFWTGERIQSSLIRYLTTPKEIL